MDNSTISSVVSYTPLGVHATNVLPTATSWFTSFAACGEAATLANRTLNPFASFLLGVGVFGHACRAIAIAKRVQSLWDKTMAFLSGIKALVIMGNGLVMQGLLPLQIMAIYLKDHLFITKALGPLTTVTKVNFIAITFFSEVVAFAQMGRALFSMWRYKKAPDKNGYLRSQLQASPDEIKKMMERKLSRLKSVKAREHFFSKIDSSKVTSLTRRPLADGINAPDWYVENQEKMERYFAHKVAMIELGKEASLKKLFHLSDKEVTLLKSGKDLSKKASEALGTNLKKARNLMIVNGVVHIVVIASALSMMIVFPPQVTSFIFLVLNTYMLINDGAAFVKSIKEKPRFAKDTRVLSIYTAITIIGIAGSIALTALSGGTFPIMMTAITVTTLVVTQIYAWYHHKKALISKPLENQERMGLRDSLEGKLYIRGLIESSKEQAQKSLNSSPLAGMNYDLGHAASD